MIFCTSQLILQKLHCNPGGMILGVETCLQSFPEAEGKDFFLHMMSLLMYVLLFSFMLQMQHRCGSVIILSCFHAFSFFFFFLTWTARRINI